MGGSTTQTRRLRASEADELYHVSAWGEGFFRISDTGTLQVTPDGTQGPAVDLLQLMEQLRSEGHGPPVLLRFPQILTGRVQRMHTAFNAALEANGCKGVRYRGVFPIKVNQRKEVVQALAAAGRRHHYGLEVGSKAELVAALTMDPNRRSPLIINGFKDRAFLEAACAASALKDEVIIVLDEIGELPHLLPLLHEAGPSVSIGLRLKLRSKVPGKWASSGGDRAKFGLTIPEVLHAVELLQEAGQGHRLQMLHFHIGSQLSDIRRISQGVREAARIHVELRKKGVPLRLLDVGGGLAVDYDGSGSSSPNSANYTLEEYASSVVATLKDVCDDGEVPVPDIISESGRAVVSHHAILVVNVLRRVPYMDPDADPGGARPDDPTPLANLYDVLASLTAKNAFESFHDALQYRDDLQSLFDLGHLDIEQLGRAEVATRTIIRRIRTLLADEGEEESEEYIEAGSILSQKLVCNFSLFQSVPDIWGVKQQFPILPLHRLHERPTELASVADITCDSDGEVRRFIDPLRSRDGLPVHAPEPEKPYYLAFCLVGAYQDTLGDYHNLLGETDEVFVTAEADGSWHVSGRSPGSRVADMLRWVRYNPSDLLKRLRGRLQRAQERGDLSPELAQQVAQRFQELIQQGTYLQSAPPPQVNSPPMRPGGGQETRAVPGQTLNDL